MPVETISTAQGAVDRVVLMHPSGTRCEVRTLGATVTSWMLDGKERLFVSDKAITDGSRPIRGGIPLVFPQFGTGPLMPGQHGFARKLRWEYTGVNKDDESEIMVGFELRDSDATRASGWSYSFRLNYLVTLTANSLGTHLAVTNTDKVAFPFTSLLHTYFATPDINHVAIDNLTGLNYTDKLHKCHVFYEDRPQVTFDQEVDRIYHGTPETLILHVSPDETMQLKSFGFEDTVVWNPWVDKAKDMVDFGDSEYKSMFCVESGSVHEAVKLPPSQTWEAGQLLELV
ncbi:hypothetical protein H4R35_007435 [Dimargaris xerosporica]|nr:hypothetical protein H4R35_007435 [Dimargaris xerosporica]